MGPLPLDVESGRTGGRPGDPALFAGVGREPGAGSSARIGVVELLLEVCYFHFLSILYVKI